MCKVKIGLLAAFLVAAGSGIAQADTHAPWPTDWNNWNDPTLWVNVGNPGNAGEWSGESYGGIGPDRICGAVDYTFRMGKFEVTAGQYAAFLNAVAATDAYELYDIHMADPAGWWGCNIQRSGSPGSYTYSVAADWANRPVNYVSWGDAARFANWLTNGQMTGAQDLTTTEAGSYYLNGVKSDEGLMDVTRIADEDRIAGKKYYFIPTEDEWYKAAYYNPATSTYYDYPTSSDSMPSNDLINPDPGNNGNFTVFWPEDITWDITIGDPYCRTEVGDFENSKSPYGTFDQGGNVWEHNEAITMPYELTRGLRGGSFATYAAFVDALHASVRSLNSVTFGNSDYGFRVSEVPEPASIALLALGGVGLLARRRGARR